MVCWVSGWRVTAGVWVGGVVRCSNLDCFQTKPALVPLCPLSVATLATNTRSSFSAVRALDPVQHRYQTVSRSVEGRFAQMDGRKAFTDAGFDHGCYAAAEVSQLQRIVVRKVEGDDPVHGRSENRLTFEPAERGRVRRRRLKPARPDGAVLRVPAFRPFAPFESLKRSAPWRNRSTVRWTGTGPTRSDSGSGGGIVAAPLPLSTKHTVIFLCITHSLRQPLVLGNY
ncbi:hypothetical protein DFJ73DRAFT_468166 [Zopfochytrium polystomum]|nr:hypothetical protein DFJ73DRAFT_468166 [Zopfochytrium polystomum]